jgi:hypothetical protein
MGKAQVDLPTVEHNAKWMLVALDAVLAPKMVDGKPVLGPDGFYTAGVEHPGLAHMVGRKGWGGLTDYIPFVGPIGATDAANFEAKLKQVTGKQFLQAFETLKGGGQITETEGEKATQALANLSTSQTEKQFKHALLQFRFEVGELVNLARSRAGIERDAVGDGDASETSDDPLGIR